VNEVAVRLTNRKSFTGTSSTALTCTTIIYIPKAVIEGGLAVTAKSDNDTDPINVIAFSVTGKLDATLDTGEQLATIKQDIGSAS